MLELLVLFGMLAAVFGLLERNHQRTAQLSRTPFALDLEMGGSADQRRVAEELWAVERATRSDSVREVTPVAAPRRAPQARARWI